MENQEQLLESPVSIISLFNTTKAQRESFVYQVVESVKDGGTNVLELHRNIKCLEEIIKSIKAFPEYQSALLEEAEKYEGKTFDYGNAKITIKEVGTKYDYSACGDLEYYELEASKDKIDKEIKAKQKLLQLMPKSQIVTNPETGETYEIFPAIKSSTTSVAVTLK